MCADTKNQIKAGSSARTVYSMTGFGSAVLNDDQNRYIAEARSVNSRYAETRIYGLRDDLSLEFELGKLIKQMFERGKFDLNLRKEPNKKSKSLGHEKRIADHFLYLKKLQKNLGIKSDLTLETVLKTLPQESNHGEDQTRDHENFLKVATVALKNLETSRFKEGKVLLADIQKRLSGIFGWFEKIQTHIHFTKEKRKSEVAAKIQSAIGDLPVEAKRIEGEIALIIEKADVSEELVRFQKHLQSFDDLLINHKHLKKPVGRELDFTLQELNREVNTLGAKIGDVDISKVVVNIKSEMEKIREQVQNIQ